MNNSIFGYDWEDIKRAQQGGRLARNQVPYSSPEQRKATIERDIARFKISVAASVVKSLGITLPTGYTLKGDTYVYEAPAETL